MQETWWSHNTDKILLVFVWLVADLLVFLFVLVFKVNDHDLVIWALTTASNVLGAILLLLTGRVQRADGQTANGQPPTPTDPTSLTGGK